MGRQTSYSLTFLVGHFMSLLGEQKACQILLSIVAPYQLQVKDWPALVLSDPYGTDAVQGGEGVGQVLELVADQVQNGKLRKARELRGKLGDLVVSE